MTSYGFVWNYGTSKSIVNHHFPHSMAILEGEWLLTTINHY